MNKPRILVSNSVHGTIDVVIYDMPNTKLVDWFSLSDIWGSCGYDRFNDGGLYFELPRNLRDIIPTLPFVSRYGISVEKEA